jgi:hypothetical protein
MCSMRLVQPTEVPSAGLGLGRKGPDVYTAGFFTAIFGFLAFLTHTHTHTHIRVSEPTGFGCASEASGAWAG